MSWSVSEQGLLYIFEYSNWYKQAIRKSQISKVENNVGATTDYNSSLSPFKLLAYTDSNTPPQPCQFCLITDDDIQIIDDNNNNIITN